MRFLKSDSGYALVLTLLFMPVFVGMSLLVIDISRGNNAHSDLQAAADSLALAGARELDGSADSITRAIAAMEEISNTVSFLGRTDEAAATTLTFAGLDRPFTVVFLSDLPENDDEPLTQEYLDANSIDPAEDEQGDALFVYVRAQSRDLSPFFGIFFDGVNPVTDVPIAAQAVATFRTAACNVTPLFICNPFENDPDYRDIGEAYAAGLFHARLIRLHPKGGDTASPGNFGFLQVNGANDNSNASASTIRNVFAGDVNPTCYDNRVVRTKPGAATSIAQGFNVRFDIYAGPYSNDNAKRRYPPAENVRKGYIFDETNGNKPIDVCTGRLVTETEMDWAMPFPPNEDMSEFGGVAAGAAVALTSEWDLAAYWSVNHPGSTLGFGDGDVISRFEGLEPSRYDVYRHEIDNELVEEPSLGATPPASPTRTIENGLPNCHAEAVASGNNQGGGNQGGGNTPTPPIPTTEDRRLMFAAIINCAEHLGPGSNQAGVPVESFASIFLASPMQTGSGGDGTIDVEIVDVSEGGSGTLETFVRNEAILVR
jgi:hypothetical protein